MNDGVGGLFINWRYGKNALSANNGRSIVRNGQVETSGDPLHDRLTDLRYLHGMLLYKKLSPTDRTFDSEISKYTRVVKTDFPDGTDERGWVFRNGWIFTGSAVTNGLKRLLVPARSIQKFYHKEVGALFKRNSGNQSGYYKPSEALGEDALWLKQGASFQELNLDRRSGKTAAGLSLPMHMCLNITFFSATWIMCWMTLGVRLLTRKILVKESDHGYTITGGTMRMGELPNALSHLYQLGAKPVMRLF